MPAWAMILKVIDEMANRQWHLVGVGIAILVLEFWMVIEAVLMWRRAKGQLESPLATPPIKGMSPDYVEVSP